MGTKRVVLISIVVILAIMAVYVLIARPTVVLPSIPVAVPASVPIKSIADAKNASGIDLRVRTNGTILAEVGGTPLAEIGYTPETLGNALKIGERVSAIPASTSAAIRLAPSLIPGLRTLLLNSALSAYFVLPVEVNLKLVPQ